MPQDSATFILELGRNSNFYENLKGIVYAHDLDRLGKA